LFAFLVSLSLIRRPPEAFEAEPKTPAEPKATAEPETTAEQLRA
jgi:hypothetical protein